MLGRNCCRSEARYDIVARAHSNSKICSLPSIGKPSERPSGGKRGGSKSLDIVADVGPIPYKNRINCQRSCSSFECAQAAQFKKSQSQDKLAVGPARNRSPVRVTMSYPPANNIAVIYIQLKTVPILSEARASAEALNGPLPTNPGS